MKHADFKIGQDFMCGGRKFRCIDIGTRVIVAIKVYEHDTHGWMNGPPYAIQEFVYDENDMPGCEPAP